MDSDFHYYGTGTAALASGFNKSDATTIANVAQYVDWFDSDYWSWWRIVNEKGEPVNAKGTKKQYRYEHPQLSVQKIDWKMSFDYDKNIWNTFHFPPGNLPYSVRATDWKKIFCKQHKLRVTNLSKNDKNKLCRPFSKFALDLIEDTIEKYKALRMAHGNELVKLIAKMVHPRVRCPVTNGRKLALYLLGV